MSSTTFITTNLDLTNEVASRANATSVSPIITPTLIQTEVNNAYGWAGRLFKWPALKSAKVVDANGQANYDFPPTFQPESIFRVEVAGLQDPVFHKKDFESYLDHQENNPTDTQTQIFANYGTQFFLFPVQPANPGAKNISVWGYKQVDPLVNANDVTIFSNYDPLGNEAIVKQALSVIQAIVEGKNVGMVENQEAKEILALIFSKITEEKVEEQTLDKPLFRIPDYFGGAAQQTDTGAFNITVKD